MIESICCLWSERNKNKTFFHWMAMFVLRQHGERRRMSALHLTYFKKLVRRKQLHFVIGISAIPSCFFSFIHSFIRSFVRSLDVQASFLISEYCSVDRRSRNLICLSGRVKNRKSSWKSREDQSKCQLISAMRSITFTPHTDKDYREKIDRERERNKNHKMKNSWSTLIYTFNDERSKKCYIYAKLLSSPSSSSSSSSSSSIDWPASHSFLLSTIATTCFRFFFSLASEKSIARYAGQHAHIDRLFAAFIGCAIELATIVGHHRSTLSY